ncbi:MAG TPA: hypothetical protein VGP08_03705 [Pyrinomonadaceae bacterium]|jgi:hypothetical protein|nr:hypothetical protein [Pyrinomonadaceae bacterium]
MPTWLKAVLIIGGLLLVLLLAAVGTLVYLGVKHGPALIEAGKHSLEEGHAYGRTTDEQGCVDEAVARHKRAEGLSGIISTSFFMNSCLEVSRPTPNFCDAVPRRSEFMKGAQWQMDECKRYGLRPERQCGQLFQQVQQYCELRGRTKSGGGVIREDPPDTDDDSTDSDDSEPPEPPPPPPAPPRSK